MGQRREVEHLGVWGRGGKLSIWEYGAEEGS